MKIIEVNELMAKNELLKFNSPVNALTSIFLILVVVGVLWQLAFMGGVLKTAPLSLLGGATTVGGYAPQATGAACTLSATQTMHIQASDADTNTLLSPTTRIYTDANAGSYQTSNVTTPNKEYTVLSTVSNYIAGKAVVKTGCETDPTVPVTQKALDTAVSMTVYNKDGLTANNNGSNRQLIGTGGAANMVINMQQSARNKHLGGIDNKFAVFIAGANTTDFDATGFSIAYDGVQCTEDYNGATPSGITGTVVIYKKVCVGDFAATDSSIHKLSMTVQAGGSTTLANHTIVANIAPYDYYVNTLNNKVETGVVKNDGSTIHAFQTANVYIGSAGS
jgi:hypothetical protein